jgi:hypothetical protein
MPVRCSGLVFARFNRSRASLLLGGQASIGPFTRKEREHRFYSQFCYDPQELNWLKRLT